MADEKRKPKRSCHPRQKWLPAAAAILLLVLLAVGLSVRYISFVSQTIYQESTSHLEEVLHKSNNMLKEMVRKNLTYLHVQVYLNQTFRYPNRDHKKQPLLFSVPALRRNAGCILSDT